MCYISGCAICFAHDLKCLLMKAHPDMNRKQTIKPLHLHTFVLKHKMTFIQSCNYGVQCIHMGKKTI